MKADAATNQSYNRTLCNTVSLFPGTNNFDGHTPIIYNKEKLKQIPAPKMEYGFCIKTVYCNTNKIEGEFYPHCKIQDILKLDQLRERIAGRLHFSIGDRAFCGELEILLSQLYPLPSKYA